MNFIKLSFINLKQNIKNYGMYIFSMIFSIIVFYNFITLLFSEQFKALKSLDIIVSLSGVCAFVLFLFFVYFISYSSSFFIEQRKKEFGIYTFMGVENSKIALLFAQEGLLIGLIALVGGILGGVLSNKLFLMALVKVSNVDTLMKFEISSLAIIITSAIFLFILICVFIKEYVNLLKTDISKLINATKIYQTEDSKNKTLQGLIGLIVIFLAYIVILYYKKMSIPFPIAIFATVIMVIVGTLLLFKGFFTFVVSKMIDNKQFLYKGTNILSLNNIIFRIRDNNKVLGQIAVLITCCLTCVIVSISTKTVVTEGKESQYPYSIIYEGDLDNKVVNQSLSKSNEKVDFKIETKVIPVSIGQESKDLSQLPYIDGVQLIKYSDVKKVCEYRNLDNEKKFLNTNLKDNKGIFLIPKNMINAFNFKGTLNVGNNKIKIQDVYSMNLFGGFGNDEMAYPQVIVSDNAYNDLIKQGLPEKTISCITLKNFNNSKEIANYVNDNSDIQIYDASNFKVDDFSFINGIFFMGLFMALVFIVSVGSIMYFKCISDASKDKPRFDTLRKIGTDQKYIDKSIHKQVGIFFLFPAIVSIVHSVIAAYSITNMFNQDWKLASLITIIGFSIVYIIFYVLSARKYINLTK